LAVKTGLAALNAGIQLLWTANQEIDGDRNEKSPQIKKLKKGS
jgi:hypothetical protein